MAQDDHSGAEHRRCRLVARRARIGLSTGTAVIPADAFENPGFPPHRPRVTDEDPSSRSARAHGLHALLPLDPRQHLGDRRVHALPDRPGRRDVGPPEQHVHRLSASPLALLGIGFGAVHWGKSLMADHEFVEQRHPIRGLETTRARAVEVFQPVPTRSPASVAAR